MQRAETAKPVERRSQWGWEGEKEGRSGAMQCEQVRRRPEGVRQVAVPASGWAKRRVADRAGREGRVVVRRRDCFWRRRAWSVWERAVVDLVRREGRGMGGSLLMEGGEGVVLWEMDLVWGSDWFRLASATRSWASCFRCRRVLLGEVDMVSSIFRNETALTRFVQALPNGKQKVVNVFADGVDN